MSYGVHITRAAGESGEPVPISLDEWLAVVRADPTMRVLGVFEERTPKGQLIQVSSPGLAEWIQHPQGERVLMDHSRGRISVGNPDSATLSKMCALAKRLGAGVEGDEGESYDEPPGPK